MWNDSGKFVGAAILVVLSIGFAGAFITQWPKPMSTIFAGVSLLSGFGALLVFCTAAGREYTLQVQKAIFVASGCFGLAFLGVAWKYREIAPASSATSLIAAVLLCFGALATLFYYAINCGAALMLAGRWRNLLRGIPGQTETFSDPLSRGSL